MPTRAQMAANRLPIARLEQLLWRRPGIDLINARAHHRHHGV
jgi:hypothetical protein